MPPLWVIGPEGGAELVNYRVRGHFMIVDRLFAAAELRLGGEHQKMVRIIRTDGEADNVSDREEEGGATGPSGSGRLRRNVRTDRAPIAAELRLRPERPRVTRLSRRVLMGLGAASAIAIAAALVFALWPHGPKREGEELLNTDNRNVADGLNGLPRDYAGVPRPVPQLGPPLPRRSRKIAAERWSSGARNAATGGARSRGPTPACRSVSGLPRRWRRRAPASCSLARRAQLCSPPRCRPTLCPSHQRPCSIGARSGPSGSGASLRFPPGSLAGEKRRREHDSAERSRPQTRVPHRAG